MDICEHIDPRTLQWLEKTRVCKIEDLELDDVDTLSHTRKAMCAGLWPLWHSSSAPPRPSDTVIAQGGDADSNAAIAGALAGLRYGYDALPAEKEKLFEIRLPQRPRRTRGGIFRNGRDDEDKAMDRGNASPHPSCVGSRSNRRSGLRGALRLIQTTLPWTICLIFAVMARDSLQTLPTSISTSATDLTARDVTVSAAGVRQRGDITPCSDANATFGLLAATCAVGCSLYLLGGMVACLRAGIAIALFAIAYSAGPYPSPITDWETSR